MNTNKGKKLYTDGIFKVFARDHRQAQILLQRKNGRARPEFVECWPVAEERNCAGSMKTILDWLGE